MTPEEIIKDEAYLTLVNSLNRRILEDTLEAARTSYEYSLPNLKADLADQFNINTDPMSPDTLGNWVITILRDLQKLDQLVLKHKNLNAEIIQYGLDDIVKMVGYINEGSEEWQRAICILALPLLKL